MRKILLVFAIMLAVFLVGCPNAPSNDVQEVEEYQASNLLTFTVGILKTAYNPLCYHK